MSILVTGGAGYIGSHVVVSLRLGGLDVVVVDDLSSGHRAFVPDDVPFVATMILDTPRLTDAMREHGVTGVVHLAGFKYAGVSVERPLHTYEQNDMGTASVLAAMRDAAVGNIVFSSSAAVYGTPTEDVVTWSPPASWRPAKCSSPSTTWDRETASRSAKS
jgi:UDP-glucose 4-epimerase